MDHSAVHQAITWLSRVEGVVILAIAVSTYRLWRSRQSDSAAWLAGGFTALLAIVAIGQAYQLAGVLNPPKLVVRFLLVGLVAFPYFLLRSSMSFGRTRRWHVRAATIGALAIGAWCLFLDFQVGSTKRDLNLTVFVWSFIAYWVALSVPTVRLYWKAGAAQPTISRRRMRMLAVGAASLAAILVLAGANTSSNQDSSFALVQSCLTVICIGVFYLAFTTPRLMRALWRQRDLAGFHRAQAALIGAVTLVDVCETIVPHAVAVVGGRGAVVADHVGRPLARFGLEESEAEELTLLVSMISPDVAGEPAPGVLAVPCGAGYLIVRASAQTPFFGDDEMNLLELLAQSADLAIERARLLENERESRQVLAESRSALAEAQALAHVGSWTWDLTLDRLYMSDEYYSIVGLDPLPYEPDHTRVLGIQHPEDRDRFVEVSVRAMQELTDFSHEHRIVRPDGTGRWVRTIGRVLQSENGKAVLMRGTVQDITDSKQAALDLANHGRQQAALADLGQRALSAAEPGPLLDDAVALVAGTLGVEMVAVLEHAGDYQLTLRAGTGLTEDTGTIPLRLEPDRYDGDEYDRLAGDELPAELLRLNQVRSVISCPIAGHGGSFGVLAVMARSEVDLAPFSQFCQTVADVIAARLRRHWAEEMIAHQALHDPLTGLPNWALVSDRLRQALQRARRTHRVLAVVTIDVDRFGLINDELGHAAGDDLLVQIGGRLDGVLRPADTLARHGNDEFVVLAEDLEDDEAANVLTARLAEALARPFVLSGRQVVVTASMGMSICHSGRTSAEEIVANALAALQRARHSGRGKIEVYAPGLRSRPAGLLEAEDELRKAIARGEMRLYFQPEVDLDTGRIVGAEVLVRWQHPRRGLLDPAEFLELAEETGLIIPMGIWVLQAACIQHQRWRRECPWLADMRLWVNLSARQLTQPSLVEDVRLALESSDMEPSMLGLEITESVIMDDVQTVDATLADLKALGLKLGVDDFGTGFSSLSYLRRFDVDLLKVDRSFVHSVSSSAESRAIVAAVVDLAHSLGLESTAEGVETYEQVTALREIGCDTGQGFYFSRPQPAAEFADLVRLRHTLSRTEREAEAAARVTRLLLPPTTPASPLPGPTTVPVALPLDGTRVLVCDDDERTRWTCRVVLESAGAEVSEASDGDACVEAALARHHDVIILDLFMPRRDGLSTLPELRQKAPHSVVVLMSAFPAQDLSTDDLGVVACHEKHDAVARLVEIVNEARVWRRRGATRPA